MDEAGAHTRDQLRRSYADAWRKQVAGSPLTPLESMIAGVIAWHPPYQAMLQNAEALLQVEPDPRGGAENPFLHMGLHLAVREQVAVDRPPGVRAVLRRLQARLGSAHDAEHAMMEALAETLWEAQRAGSTPDVARYLERARTRARLAPEG
jgi:hypothetical protein